MFLSMLKIFFPMLMIMCILSGHANTVGVTLEPLSFEASPHDFSYKPNGELQLITVYPAKMSSKKAGEFNLRLMGKGLCPLSITDIKNKAWYAPVSLIEEEIQKSLAADTHKEECRVSADYEGLAANAWELKSEPTTMVVDGQGSIIFFAYGALNDLQQETVLSLFFKKNNGISNK